MHPHLLLVLRIAGCAATWLVICIVAVISSEQGEAGALRKYSEKSADAEPYPD